MTSADKVVNDMRGRGISTSTAKPFVADQALDYARRRVNSAVGARVWRELGLFLTVAETHGVLFSVVAIASIASGNTAYKADSVVDSLLVIVAAADVEVVYGRALNRGRRVVETVPYTNDLRQMLSQVTRPKKRESWGEQTQMGERAVHSCGCGCGCGVALRCGVKCKSGGANEITSGV